MIEMSTIHFWSFAGRRVDLYANFHSFPSFRERFVVCLDAGNDPNVYKLKNQKKNIYKFAVTVMFNHWHAGLKRIDMNAYINLTEDY